MTPEHPSCVSAIMGGWAGDVEVASRRGYGLVGRVVFPPEGRSGCCEGA